MNYSAKDTKSAEKSAEQPNINKWSHNLFIFENLKILEQNILGEKLPVTLN